MFYLKLYTNFWVGSSEYINNNLVLDKQIIF